MVFKNYYKILDLETSHVSIDEIKIAYRQAAKKYHPDVNIGDSLAEEKIKDINEAYRILSVPASKRKYDRIWNSHFNKVQKAFIGAEKKGALFNIFLGNVGQDEKQEHSKNKKTTKGENIETQINISLQEAFFGMEKTLSIRTLEGKAKKIVVNIPQGIQNGEKIRLIGQGKPSEDGGKNGDLLIKIKIEDDQKFKLENQDIHTNLLISPWEAALGARVTIDSIDDQTKIYIPQGTQSGEKIKIPNKGYKTNNGKRGDLIAEIKIVVPEELNDKEKKLFEKLKSISTFNPRSEKK